MNYKWSSASYKGVSADKVGRELEGIERESELTNVSVLEYAKNNKNSELNKCFDWNDETAGEKWRLQQASNILSSISIVVNEQEPKETVKAFINIKTTEEKRVFKNVVSVIENDEEYTQLKERAKRDFISYKEKYNKILRLKDLKSIILENI